MPGAAWEDGRFDGDIATPADESCYVLAFAKILFSGFLSSVVFFRFLLLT